VSEVGSTVAELFWARLSDRGPALLFEDQVISWDQLVREGARRALLALDMREDGPFHIGVLLENVPEHCFWIVGAALAGAAVVGINPTRRGEELAADVRHTDCQLVVTDVRGYELISNLDLGPNAADRILVAPGACEAGDERNGTAGALVLDEGKLPDASDEELARLERQAVKPEARVLLLFTSGSTGVPKAVIVSQGRLAAIANRTPEMFGIERGVVTYQSMPMFHGNAIMANWAPVIATGATMAVRRRFSASGFLTDVRRYDASFFNYVGRALAYVLATPEQPDDHDNPLRLGFGTEASVKDIADFERRFGCRIMESYGSSEGPISIQRLPGAPPGSLGLPPDDVEVAIVDPQSGKECPPACFDENGALVNASEAIGEIVGRNVASRFEGYYRNDVANAERLRNGWYWSGDLGYRDAEGWFYFAGRGTDRLRVDGENFAAAPIERILGRFPPVLVAAVYPVPDPETGDNVMCALELVSSESFDAEAFAAFLEAQPDLGTKWAPRFVRIVPSMPLTASNKIHKARLAVEQWSVEDPVYWRPGRSEPYRVLTDDDRHGLEAEFRLHGREALLPILPEEPAK